MNVHYVQGLQTNLITVGQLYDEGMTVVFNKVKCWAYNGANQVVISGALTGNNCHMREEPTRCLNAVKDNSHLRHQHLS